MLSSWNDVPRHAGAKVSFFATATMRVLTTTVLVSVCCLPATIIYDPDSFPGLQPDFVASGQIAVTERCQPSAPNTDLVEVVVDEVEVRPLVLSEPSADDPDGGRFQLSLRPGLHTLRFKDARIADEGAALEDLRLTVEGLPGEEVALLNDEGDKLLRMREGDAPTPFSIMPLPEVVAESSVVVTVDEHAIDAQGNLFEYQFRVGAGDWDHVDAPNLPGDGDVITWAAALTNDANNMIAWRAVDCEGNAGPQNVAFVRQDNLGPVSPDPVILDEGNGFVDVRWTVDPLEVGASYLVQYGPNEQLGGVSADQGETGFTVVGDHVRLTGITNGVPLFVRIVAKDAVGNTTPSSLESALPAVITPELVGARSLANGRAVASARSGDTLYVLTAPVVQVQVFDLSRPDPGAADPVLAHTLDDMEGATDLAAWRNYLVVARGGTLTILDQPLPSVTRLRRDIALTDEVPGCDASCEAVAVAVRAGVVFVAVRSALPFVGGLWRISLEDATDPVTLDVVSFDRSEGGLGLVAIDPVHDRLVGPLRVFGDYVAVGYETVLSTPYVDPDPVTVATRRAVLIARHQGGTPTPCLRIEPRVDGTFNERFIGTNIDTNIDVDRAGDPIRVPFEVYGDYLALGLDGAFVLDRINNPSGPLAQNLAEACADALALEATNTSLTPVGTLELAMGAHNLGLLSATSVHVAGGYAFVGQAQRASLLPEEEQLDIITLDALQGAPGAPGGNSSAFTRVGRLPRAPVGAMYLEGTWLTLVTSTAVEVWEVFEPRALVPVASVGENPTGQNVPWGNYLVHQRATRGVGVWDFSQPQTPTLRNGSTCVPGCLLTQDLAGDAFVDGGYLFSPLNGDPSDVSGQLARTLTVVDVGSDVSVLQDKNALENPCAAGAAQGFAAFEQYAFLGCAETDVVRFVNLAHPDRGAPIVEAGSFTLGSGLTTRALAVGRMGSEPDSPWYLFVLAQTGDVLRYELVTGLTPTDGPTIVFDDAPALNEQPAFDFGHTLKVEGRRLYVLGGRSVEGCDPYLTASCIVQASELRVFDLHQGGVLASWALQREVIDVGQGENPLILDDDTKLSLLATPGVTVLGRSREANRYELYLTGATDSDVDWFEAPIAVAGPNALPLSATFIGGHFVPADMRVYRLE